MHDDTVAPGQVLDGIAHEAPKPIKIIYIGGYGRSGSTLLARLLGEISGVVFAGELFDIWHRGFTENCLCGCGEPFRSCGFWRRVVREGFVCDISDLSVRRIQTLRLKIRSYWRIPALGISLLRSPSHRRQLIVYRRILDNLYRGIQRASGSQFIVDSSKVPQFAWLLNEIDGLEVHVIHLVRDSRAVAYSWRRQKLEPAVHWRLHYIDRHSILRSALEWNLFNVFFEISRRRFASYTLVRYEDFVADPRRELQRVAQSIGAAWSQNLARLDKCPYLSSSHSVFGNPDRFLVGPVTIQPDVEWQKVLSQFKFWFISVLTFPLLLKYRYNFRRSTLHF